MDPDYEVTDLVKQQAKEREEKEKVDVINKVKTIINNEFRTELELREKQMEDIQNKITKVSKTLHLLRYVLITSYYNRNELLIQQTEDDAGSFDPQSRLHPAVKAVINERAKFGLDFRRKSTRQSKLNEHLVIQESNDSTLKQIEMKKEVIEEIKVKKENTIKEDIVPIRNRQMIKKRIVVGNISKWMPSESSEDNSTHKWMVYVRGPKANPQIDDFVQKVIFYLHPSYHPNDVIELRDPPFHLSRRGWGEFPLRVQIFFHCSQNKPVDIIHNLKLDRTYTGRQTLGNETLVDLTIYSNKILEDVHIKEEHIDIKEEPINIKEEFNHENDSNIKEPIVIKEEFIDHVNISALSDHTYSLNSAPNVENEKTIVMNDGKTLIMKKRKGTSESLLKPVMSKKFKTELNDPSINYEKFIVKIPSGHFRNIVEALPYLLKRHPLITKLGSDLNYKCTYPYVASSLEAYKSWPMEKRQSSEWSRARKVLKVLISSNFNCAGWNTKKILQYARAHGFTELANYDMFKGNTYPEDFIIKNSVEKIKYLHYEEDLPIDIENQDNLKETKNRKCNLVHAHLIEPCNYIKQVALDAGVILKSEEIIPGVMYNASQRVILEATMCFAENLIRNARALLVYKDKFSEETSEVGVDQIMAVLNSHRTEFKAVLNYNKDAKRY